MRISDYFKKFDERPYTFAKRAKVRPATIYALRDGKAVNLTQETMRKIVQATGGKVRLEDLL